MDLEIMKELFAEKMNVKYFDAYVRELQHWQKDVEVKSWYEKFAEFCFEYAS